jgi:CPA2 family monovalent cation:H+ antiporter-2
MTPIVAAASGTATVVFIEIGAVFLILSLLARLAARLGVTAIPLYLLAGLAVGKGGVAPLDVSADFIHLAGEIGVLLLLLTLGLEYSAAELRDGLRGGVLPGVVDAAANFVPGFLVGLALGWKPVAAVLLGGVCWVSSSGVVSRLLVDLGRRDARTSVSVLHLLVFEDLAMAVYLPVAGALVAGGTAGGTMATVLLAVGVVAGILVVALRWGDRLSRLLTTANDESLLLAVFGLTLLIGGLAQRVQVSAAIGAFLVGLALSGPVKARAAAAIGPLRDLFAATFFLVFSFSVDPSDLPAVALPAAVLAALGVVGKVASGWAATRAHPAAMRAGAVLIARGEFSIVIAALGAGTADGPDLAALAAAYVLFTALLGPVAAKLATR